MALYHEAAGFLVSSQEQSGSLRLRVFNSKTLKSPPKQVYALVAEASRWSPVLAQVIDTSQLLKHERKLSPSLALVLVHDLLISKSGIAAPASHPLRAAVARHKARLSAELTKFRIKKGFQSISDLRSSLSAAEEPHTIGDEAEAPLSAFKTAQWPHPRWVRINTVKTTSEDQVRTTFADYRKVSALQPVISATSGTKILFMDEHVPDLLALPPGADLTATTAYRTGCIILQDKASCFPAYILDPQPEHGDCLDACAAPGNKTTHLAAISRHRYHGGRRARVWACEKDKSRSETLTRMINLAGCNGTVTIKRGQDFLLLDPEKAPWRDVWSLLLDPSCSGSGIVGRDETLIVTLPVHGDNVTDSARSRKRKHGTKKQMGEKPILNEDISGNGYKEDQLSTRLKSLSAFQLKLILHAFRFPNARRISYSTCSIYAEENEAVVMEALRSKPATHCGWRLLKRAEQVQGMRTWPVRGDVDTCRALAMDSAKADEIAKSCIRCQAGTVEGTQGFFVAVFVRDPGLTSEDPFTVYQDQDTPPEGDQASEVLSDHDKAESSDEWEGLSDAG